MENVRTRFQKVMQGQKTTAPILEWAPWWDQTIRSWEQEGLPRGMDSYELFRYFGLDNITQIWFPHKSPGCPPDPAYGEGIIRNESDYKAVRPYLYPKDAIERMKPQIEAAMPLYEKGDTVIWITVDGFFWFPRVLFGIEQHLYSFYDHPDLYHRICEDLLEFQLRVIEEFSHYMQADFITVAEDMSYNNGPMLSQEFFEEFMRPYYRRLIPEIQKHQSKVFIDSDGDIQKAIPWFLDAGIEGILPLERQAGVDLNAIRQRYPDLLLLGGFDKMVLFRGKDAIRKEFERLLPVIQSGRYLIGMDHQTPPGVPLEDYRYYIQLLKEYCSHSGEKNE